MSPTADAIDNAPGPELHDSSTHERSRSWLASTILLAFVLRICIAIMLPTSDYPDEIFQTREPAHRLAYGVGVVTWEFRDGIRNWVFPGILAGVMKATGWIAPGSFGYSFGVSVFLVLLSLSLVWVAFRWAERTEGLPAAIAVGVSCAVWYELIYYSRQALTEVVAAHFLLPGLYLGYFAAKNWTAQHAANPAHDAPPPAEAVPPSTRELTRLFVSGALCGIAVGLRVHLAPAVFLAMICFCRSNWRKWFTMAAGIALPLLIFGAVDRYTWGTWFASYWNSITVNVLHHKSNLYGKEPLYWYFMEIGRDFGPVLVLALFAIRRHPFLATMAAALVGTHMLFGHKEYRFIFPAVPILCILIGFGALAIFDWAKEGLPQILAFDHSHRAIAAASLIAAMSLLWGIGFGHWYRQAIPIRAFRELSIHPDVCGVGVDHWFTGSGYFYLHHNVPIYQLQRDPVSASAFNYAATYDLDEHRYAQFHPVVCWGRFCVFQRAGGCSPVKGYNINDALKATGE